MNNEIDFSERFEMEGNILTNDFEPLHQRMITNDAVDESNTESSEQQNNNTETTSNCGRNKETNEIADSRSYGFEVGKRKISSDNLESYKSLKSYHRNAVNFVEAIEDTTGNQNTLNFEVERNKATIKKAKNRIGDEIFFDSKAEFTELLKNAITKSEVEAMKNTNKKTSENRQDEEDPHTNIMTEAQALQNEDFPESVVELCSKLNAFKVPQRSQFTLSKFDHDLLTEDISPYQRDNSCNVTVLKSNQENKISHRNESAPTPRQLKLWKSMEEIIKIPESATEYPIDKTLRSITTIEKPKNGTTKRKKPSSQKNARQTKMKPKATTHLQELEVFLSNSFKGRHPYLSFSTDTGLKMAAFVMDIMERVGNEAMLLVAMTDKKQIDSRTLKYAIKLCLERMKVEADVAAGKRDQWLF